MKPDRWYYVEIFERDLEESSYGFVGRIYKESPPYNDAIFMDQDGRWYFVWNSGRWYEKISDEETHYVRVEAEAVFSGNTFDELQKNARKWVDQVRDGKWPEILKVPA